MNESVPPEARTRRQREIAPHVKLPEPGERRFPVGTVLIVLWISVFLAIFAVLAQLKLRGAPVQAPSPSVAPHTAPAPADSGEPTRAP